MKNYRITVNGTTYDVAVEEADGSAVSAAPAPKAAAPAPKAAAPAPKPAAKVDSGKAVKKGEVLLILEAMKMENEIVAPQDGTVASVNVQVGSQVEAGDTLVTLN